MTAASATAAANGAPAGGLHQPPAVADFRVKAALTPRRRPRANGYRETGTVAEGARRFVRAIGRRIAEGDPEQLAELVRLQDTLDDAWRVAVDGLRAQGRSDTEIGRPLGISRQAVGQRWPKARQEVT